MQHTDKMREEFEAWCMDADDGPQVDPMWMTHVDQATNEYALDQIQRDWRTWQASRRKLDIELPEPREGRTTYLDDDARDEGWNDCLEQCLAAIEAAGVKVKE